VGFLLDAIAAAPYRQQLENVIGLCLAPRVSDITANGPTAWWVDAGNGLEAIGGFEVDSQHFDAIIRMLLALAGRHIDLSSPIADGVISVADLPQLEPFGVSRLRVHAVLGGSVSGCSLLSIRVHRSGVASLESLVGHADAGRLAELVERRENFLICGATGTGKTTLMRAMLAHPSNLRTVIVEDSAELLPVPGNVVALQERRPAASAGGEISLQALMREALRMRPDRVMVGEARGAEIAVLLQTMTTGHSGSGATLHAASPSQVLARIGQLAAIGGLESGLAKELARGSIQKTIFMRRSPSGQRSVEIVDGVA
jgi:pilus assembly protein CpaF